MTPLRLLSRPRGARVVASGFVGISCSAADYGPLVRHALAHFATRDPLVHVSGAIEARVEASAGRRSKKASGSA